MSKNTRIVAVAALLVWICGLTYAGVEDDWRKARKQDTAEGYAAFVQKYEHGKYSKDANAALRRKRLDFALQSNDPRALEAFVKLYPDGDDTVTVKQALEAIRSAESDRKRANVELSATTNPQSNPVELPNAPFTLWTWVGFVVNALVLLVVLGNGVGTYKVASTRANPRQAKRGLVGAIAVVIGCGVLWAIRFGVTTKAEAIVVFASWSLLVVGSIVWFNGVFSKTPEEAAKAEAEERRREYEEERRKERANMSLRDTVPAQNRENIYGSGTNVVGATPQGGIRKGNMVCYDGIGARMRGEIGQVLEVYADGGCVVRWRDGTLGLYGDHVLEVR